MRIETQAVHAGRHTDRATGAITPPIHLSTTFERGPGGEYPLGFSYSREDNPNRQALEQCMAALEGGKECLAFASGLAVVTALVHGLEPGDHIIAPDDVYYGLRKVLGDVFGKWKLETTYVDMTDLAAVRAAVRPATRLVCVETPSNPLLKITDLAEVAGIARQANAISVCDGTFATPVLQRPFEHGIDMVMHSTTKYIGGHSDVVGGALIAKFDNYLFERARKSQRFGGAVPSPFDCWLTLRGVDTLPYRVRAQSENASKVAAFLAAHPRVEAVHYPGLASHPGHGIAVRQMSGFGGMLSFQVRGGEKTAMALAAQVKIFTRATSLGGPHSLIEHRASVEGPQSRTPRNLLRMSIGLEHPDDLISDLDQAFGAVPPKF
ncbi:MAG: aminotransferase class V-fold PLP-dependent enzyme [Bryobacteraceae bacterium]